MDSAVFSAPGSDINRSYLIEDLGTRFELSLCAYKKYPTGGPPQAAIQGLLELVASVDRRSIEHVRIELPPFLLEAFRDASMPANSLPYLTAVILIDGKLDFDSAQSLERMRSDPMVRDLMKRVEVLADPGQKQKTGEPRPESARVTITMRGGDRHERFVDGVLGFPSHPMSRNDVEQKALELMIPKLGKQRAQKVVQSISSIESLKDAADLVELIAV